VNQGTLTFCAPLLLLAACSGGEPAQLPLDRCFPGVWRIGVTIPDCAWCDPRGLATSECSADDCEWMEIAVLRGDGVADRREIQVSRADGHFSSCRDYSTARTWEQLGDELVINSGEISEERYDVVGCFGSSVTVDAPWVTGVTRYWTRPEDDIAHAALAASESGLWTEVPLAR